VQAREIARKVNVLQGIGGLFAGFMAYPVVGLLVILERSTAAGIYWLLGTVIGMPLVVYGESLRRSARTRGC
jgi:hypothetical protein